MSGDCVSSLELKPQRKIRPTRRSVSGAYVFREEKAIPFESTLERDFLIRQAFIPEVRDIVAQPVSIPFTYSDGRQYTYTPDYLVLPFEQSAGMAPKPMLVEVKPTEQWRENWRKWLPKWKAAYRYAVDNGWSFRIHDEDRIGGQALDNIRFILRYARTRFPPRVVDDAIDAMRQIECIAIRELLATGWAPNLEPKDKLPVIWHLLANRKIICDLCAPLNEHTEVRMLRYGGC